MNLKETITYLEEYYGNTSEEFYSDEVNELRCRVEQAFGFTEDELEQALSDHSEYAFVRFSSLEYYEGTYTGKIKNNLYKSAIIPRMIANIFNEYWQNAFLYKSWWKLEEDIQKQNISSDESFKAKLIYELLHKIENNGYGYIVSEIKQERSCMLVYGDEYRELRNNYSWKKPIGSFEKDDDGNLKFKFILPELEDVFMVLASGKFETLERKRVKNE